MTLFIGDVHGKFRRYHQILVGHINTIQVGDMGVGFFHHTNAAPYENPSQHKMKLGGHRFIRGNHDNPRACLEHPQWIKDGTIEGDVMFIGGATSIDRAMRVINRSWWPDEELSPEALNLLVAVYRISKPRVMVTHECPNWVAEAMGYNTFKYTFKYDDPSATRQAFQSMSEFHQPDIWIFGHWHRSFDKTLNGTRYICLAELETKEVEVGLI